MATINLTGRHHLVAGTFTGLCLTASAILSDQHDVLVVGAALLATIGGSVFPDIDTSTSKLGRKMKIASKLIGKLFGHRGFLHSPLFIGLTWVLCWYLFRKYDIGEYALIYKAFEFGMLNHLFCDSLTRSGVPILYPFSKVKLYFTKLRSGSRLEFLTLLLTCILALMLTFVFWCGGVLI